MTGYMENSNKSISNGMKLLLGAGKDRRDGWISVDKLASLKPDVTWDLTIAPWPWQDESVEYAEADNLAEHIGWGPNGEDLLMVFMNEAHRVIMPGGQLLIRVPDFRYWLDGAVKDPTHRRYFVSSSFDYWKADHQTYKNYGSFYGYKPWNVNIETDKRFLTARHRRF